MDDASGGHTLHNTQHTPHPTHTAPQGQFGAAEPVSRVFEWVAGCLRPSGGAGGAPPMFELVRSGRGGGSGGEGREECERG